LEGKGTQDAIVPGPDVSPWRGGRIGGKWTVRQPAEKKWVTVCNRNGWVENVQRFESSREQQREGVGSETRAFGSEQRNKQGGEEENSAWREGEEPRQGESVASGGGNLMWGSNGNAHGRASRSRY